MREVTSDAPGRVNLIGEHTDYHQGFVLPTVIPQRARVGLRMRHDRTVQVTSREIADSPLRFAIGSEAVTHTWVDYIQGVTFALRDIAADLPGFDLHIESDVPLGSGLSSSAALVVAVLRAVRDAFDLSFDDVQLARIAQRAETDFVGAPVGIMDPMACSLARSGEALFLDTRSLAFERIPLPAAGEFVVINSGVPHQHAGGDYAMRRRESFDAAERLGVQWLRDLDIGSLSRIDALPDVLARRARHVVTENQRVHEAVEALSGGDLLRAGALFYASHASMRDDYQISTFEIDTLVELSKEDPDVYGARMTGGGFGGSVVMLVRAQMSNDAATRMLSEYHRRANRDGTVLFL